MCMKSELLTLINREITRKNIDNLMFEKEKNLRIDMVEYMFYQPQRPSYSLREYPWILMKIEKIT